MSAIPYVQDILDESVSLLPLPDVAEHLGVSVTKVHQMLRDHQLLAVRRNGIIGVPALFLDDAGDILRWVPGLVSVLRDGGFDDEEALEWLFREDESLPGRPVDALHTDSAREVVRRAQAMAF
ncbi:DNA-binding protein [Rhodococcus rhodnii]|uniref:Uncharacterized protein n=2 Tax=Rhodococcus rhodnii TaxID=38312 RepID=R7WVG6_9NOCA|nr:Rv2175c family DNA-binding protein [Rhodococcus rhodnii]EOM78149.1 hypothetical protein Rrhod_0484 [Rhodococcus rhodnii LMG 5362]TXG92768.1 DNA-binding protein [Rhodococcus rhodnii]